MKTITCDISAEIGCNGKIQIDG
jgi:hypothetical protein